jgi:hypothetical protein
MRHRTFAASALAFGLGLAIALVWSLVKGGGFWAASDGVPCEPVTPDEPSLEATRPRALTRRWWLTAVRGLVHTDLLVRLLGVSADLTGVLRVLGRVRVERQLGRR